MIYLAIAALALTITLIVTDMVTHAPGERRRARVHTKSHYHKLGSRR
jgi:hypothetical protein